MIKYNLGRVMPKYVGEYNPTTVYDEMDIVLYGGSSFISLQPENTDHTPTEGENPYWGLVAKHGERESLTPEEIQAIEREIYDILVEQGVVFDSQYNHTQNDYSNADKAVVTDIKQNPDKYVNQQADWDEQDTTKATYIKNKPSVIDDPDYIHTDNNFTDALKTKLQSLNPNAEQNVQSDWNNTDTNSDAYIKNKPTIPTRTSQLTNNSNFVVDANYTHNPNPFTDALKDKLESTNVLTDTMVNKINGIVPEPVETVVTDTRLTITNLQGNYVYRCVNPLINLQIQNVNVGYVPTLFYFTTGDTFVWQFPNALKSTQYVDFDHNQSYVVAVMNNILTYSELVQ